jgi:hypothetical protein
VSTNAGLALRALGTVAGLLLVVACNSANRGTASPGSGGASGASGGPAVTAAGSSGVGGSAPLGLAIDPAVFGKGDLSKIAFAAFSQSNVNNRDPQLLALAPDLVPRAWGQWDTSGLKAADYDFTYPSACQANGTAFIGGLTASVIFQDEMTSDEFADQVGRDAANAPVPHSEVVPNAFRGSLASPGFRQRLIDIAKIQIDGGVDGLFFDEVNSSFIGTSYNGDEGFDDHFVADFGRFLCAKYDATKLAAFDLSAADGLDCAASDPGASFDYRGYLARHDATAAPLSAANPLQAAWGTTLQNRPDPSAGTFVETYPALVYFQRIVLAVRRYAREKYGKEILITANGIFPFVDFQSVGLYDWNHDGPGPKGFDWVPVVNGHFAGAASFGVPLAALKAHSQSVLSASGSEVPLLLFLDWPTDSINRYYALPLSERQDYLRAFLAEASSLGMWFAVPLATTTDTQTATALGVMSSLQALRAFYTAHRELFLGAKDAPGSVQSSLASAGTRLATLPDGRLVLYLQNHDYSAGFVPHASVSVSFPSPSAPTQVTLASPDSSADAPAQFSYQNGVVTVTIDQLQSSLVVVVQ